jgi:hypothetical protein
MCFGQNTCPNFGQMVLKENFSKFCGSSVFSTILIGVLSIFKVKTAIKYITGGDFRVFLKFSIGGQFFLSGSV